MKKSFITGAIICALSSFSHAQSSTIVNETYNGKDAIGRNSYNVTIIQNGSTVKLNGIAENAYFLLKRQDTVYLYNAYNPVYDDNGVYICNKPLPFGSWEVIDGENVKIISLYYSQHQRLTRKTRIFF
jgi:hypothetical protein